MCNCKAANTNWGGTREEEEEFFQGKQNKIFNSGRDLTSWFMIGYLHVSFKKYTEKSVLFILAVQALDKFEPRFGVNNLPVWNCNCKHCVFASVNWVCVC